MDVWVLSPAPLRSCGEEGRAGRAEDLLCHGRNEESPGTHSTTAPATSDSPALTGSLQ